MINLQIYNNTSFKNLTMAPNKKQKLNVKAASKNCNKNLKTNIDSLTKKSDEVEKTLQLKDQPIYTKVIG